MQKEFFIQNRNKLLKLMKSNSLAVLDSNQLNYGNEDEVLPFIQNNDFLYLTGITQKESKLIIAKKENSNSSFEIILYLLSNKRQNLTWTGEYLSFDQAAKISGITQIKPISEFKHDLLQIGVRCEWIYLNSNEHQRSLAGNYHFNSLLIWVKEIFPLHTKLRLAPFFTQLRMIKTNEEVKEIKKSIIITQKAFEHVLPLIKPGLNEKEIEAELATFFIKKSHKSIYNCFAFPPVIASGTNACILHYFQNNQVLTNNQLLLLDFGASYGYYKADITRVVPVNKKFSPRQRKVYQSLLIAQKKIITLLQPNTPFTKYNEVSKKIMQETLLELKLITKPSDYSKYFMHGVSHSLGLGVHDSCDYTKEIKAGMVLTCEPGIYIVEEGMGIRLEDNVLITNHGPEVLSEGIPKEINELERMMS